MNDKIFTVLLQLKSLYPKFHELNCMYKNTNDREYLMQAKEACFPMKIIIDTIIMLGYCKTQPYFYDYAAYDVKRAFKELIEDIHLTEEIKSHECYKILINLD